LLILVRKLTSLETQQYFFSYSRKDSDFVIKLAGDLKKAGIDVWVDQLDILPGARWDDSIEKGLHNASGMLVVLSETSIQSENVMDEVSYALEKGKRVVPLLIHNCDVPFRLARLQYIDFTKDYNTASQHLVQTLNAPQASLPVSEPARQSSNVNTQGAQPQNGRSLSQPKQKKNFLIPVIAVVIIIIALAVYFIPKGNDSNKQLPNASPVDTAKNVTDIKNTSPANTDTNSINTGNSTAGLSIQDMLKKATAAKLNNDFDATVYWYKQAALAGDKTAYVNLGNVYDAFAGRQPNIDSATYWYLKAVGNNATGYTTQQGLAYIQQEANNNKPVCMEFLGHLYMNGYETIPKDDNMAVSWLKKAMVAGNVFAKGFYGIMLYEGRGGLTANRTKGHALISQVYNVTNNNYWKEVLDNHP
jgi:hypothetical protein